MAVRGSWSGMWRKRASCAPWLVVALLFLALGGLVGEVRGQTTRESDLKAAFLFNFLTFVEWPEGTFDAPDAPFVIGVLGSNPLTGALKVMVEGETIEGRRVNVRPIFRLEDVRSCHIIYINRSEAWRMNRVLRAIRGGPILTVADIPGFAARGGMIEFHSEYHFIRLSIHRGNARNVGLRISSKLLQLAQVVDEEDPPP